MINVCCLKWGTKYSPDYVNKLAAMVRRHLHRPHRFVCLTDDKTGIDSSIECLPLLDEGIIGWWNKLSFFRPQIHDLHGTLLFLDLDLVILSDIGPFFDYPGKFCGINFGLFPAGCGEQPLNSSVFRLEIGQYAHVYEDFMGSNRQRIMSELHSDQEWIHAQIKDGVFWPSHWCVSFRWQCALPCPAYPLLPKEAKVIVFHGAPNPHEAMNSTYEIYGPDWIVKKPFPLGHPARWIKTHWNLEDIGADQSTLQEFTSS